MSTETETSYGKLTYYTYTYCILSSTRYHIIISDLHQSSFRLAAQNVQCEKLFSAGKRLGSETKGQRVPGILYGSESAIWVSEVQDAMKQGANDEVLRHCRVGEGAFSAPRRSQGCNDVQRSPQSRQCAHHLLRY